jgi:hypothetical protein
MKSNNITVIFTLVTTLWLEVPACSRQAGRRAVGQVVSLDFEQISILGINIVTWGLRRHPCLAT